MQVIKFTLNLKHKFSNSMCITTSSSASIQITQCIRCVSRYCCCRLLCQFLGLQGELTTISSWPLAGVQKLPISGNCSVLNSVCVRVFARLCVCVFQGQLGDKTLPTHTYPSQIAKVIQVLSCCQVLRALGTALFYIIVSF